MAVRSLDRNDSISNVIVGIMVGIIIMLCAILAYSNWPRISGWFGMQATQTGSIATGDIQTGTNLFVGKEVGLSGILLQDGDLTSYTHTLTTVEYGRIGLKSTSVALQQFNGTVIIGGIVDDYINGIYVIRVNTLVPISPATTGDIQTGDANAIITGVQFVPAAGIVLSHMSEAGMTVFVDTSAQKVRIAQSGDLQKEVVIDYFRCDAAKNSTNCAATRDNLIASSRVDYTDTYGNAFYEIPEANSWFGVMDNTWGYYIGAPDKPTLSRTLSYVSFMSESYVKSLLQPYMQELCKNDLYTLVSMSSFTLTRNGNEFFATLGGTDYTNNVVTCTVAVDPSRTRGGTLEMMEVAAGSGAAVDTGILAEATGATQPQPSFVSSVTKDASVQQVAINTAETLDFVAKVGYTIKFPSKSIYFSADNISENLGHDGLYCYVETKVINYKDKDNLDTDPDVKVYVCKDNGSLEATLKNAYLVSRDTENNRMYLTEIKDPARYDFATNIVMQASTGTVQ